MRRLHVITGAPGTGKTSILEALADEFTVVAEPARRVLAAWRADGNPLPARMDAGLMVRRMTELAIDDHAKARSENGTVLFDRGVVDSVAYARHLGLDPEAAARVAADHRYDRRVLLTTPWRSIYTTDEERTMEFEDVEQFHRAVVDSYTEAGYELIPVPTGPLQERVAFVKRHIRVDG